MTRVFRPVLLGLLAVVGLLIAVVVLPVVAGIIAGYLSAPKPAPHAVEVVRYVDRPVAASPTSTPASGTRP